MLFIDILERGAIINSVRYCETMHKLNNKKKEKRNSEPTKRKKVKLKILVFA